MRLHHVFEHFDRPTALRLLIDWHEWLAPGGTLTIETPDFERAARAFAAAPRRADRGTVLRHLFGSHEAAWAVHWDGWYEERYRRTLGALGFGTLGFARENWRDTHNITVTAVREGGTRDRETQLSAADRAAEGEPRRRGRVGAPGACRMDAAAARAGRRRLTGRWDQA